MRINIVQLGTLLLTDVYGEFRRWSARLPGHLLRRVISRADCQLRFARRERIKWRGNALGRCRRLLQPI